MKKKHNEFEKELDELEIKVQLLNQKKALVSRRLKKVAALQEQKKEAKEKFLEAEEEVARTGHAKDKLGIVVSILIVTAIIVVPYYRKDPVSFWFYVITGICYVGFYTMSKYSK